MGCFGFVSGEVWDRALRLKEKMRTNLLMAKDRLEVLGRCSQSQCVFPVCFTLLERMEKREEGEDSQCKDVILPQLIGWIIIVGRDGGCWFCNVQDHSIFTSLT